jgi:hypothetical protein
LYILPIALHVSIVHSIQGELDTIECSIVNRFATTFGRTSTRQLSRRNFRLTFIFCITLHQIKTVISPPPFSRTESPNRRHMPTFYERAPVRLEPPDHTPLRLIQGWHVLPRVLDWPAMNFCYHACHVPSACGCVARIRPIGLDKNSRRCTFTDEGKEVRYTAIDGSRKRQEYVRVVLLRGPHISRQSCERTNAPQFRATLRG